MGVKNLLLVLFIGVFLGAALLFGFQKLSKSSDEAQNSYSYLLINQIEKMNKMVVVEQNTSVIQKTKFSNEFLGKEITSNHLITFTKTNAQVSYNLNVMKIEVDSVNKQLVIKKLPPPELKIIPSVEIQTMDDSFLNRISETEIRNVTESGKKAGINSINQNQLKSEAKKQLMKNLDHIFVLAKTLKYTIKDETQQLKNFES